MKTKIQKLDYKLWGVILLVANVGLIHGRVAEAFMLHTHRLSSYISCHFAHLSIWHFLLDAGAFLSLLWMMRDSALWKRITLVLTCAASVGITAAVSLSSSGLNTYCGLSGIAHGLYGALALQMIFTSNDKLEKYSALTMLMIAVAKVAYEVSTGSMLFSSFHLGNIGTPIPASHAAGLISGLITWAAIGKLNN